ncbi:MAG: putative capsular polysaccharide synthesis family protein [Eubacteriales bacterium]
MIKINSKIDKELAVYRNKKIVLWGTDSFALEMYRLLKYFNLSIYAFSSNDDNMWNKTINDSIVISPEKLKQLASRDTEVVVQIAVNTREVNELEIEDDLQALGIQTYITATEAFAIIYMMRKINMVKENPKILMDTMEDDNYYVASVSNQLFRFMWDNFHVPNVIMCIPPKSGNYTFRNTLKENNIPFHSMAPIIEAFDKERLECIGERVKVITAVREPIGQNVSLVYQFIATMGVMRDCNSFGICSNIDVLLENGGNAQAIFDEWLCHVGYMETSDNRLPQTTRHMEYIQGFIPSFQKHIVDIMREPFDKEKGYSIIKDGKTEVFVYQLERLSDIVKEVSEWIGVPFEQLSVSNVGEDKWVAQSYKQAKKELVITQEYFDKCFSEPYLKHFYSNEDINRFKDKWRGHIQ